jgi:hypothetical protein
MNLQKGTTHMKKQLFAVLAVCLILLTGCASDNANDPASTDISGMDEMQMLDAALEQLDTANSIEWKSRIYGASQLEGQDESTSETTSEQTYIKEPFTRWVRSVSQSGETPPFEVEMFQTEKDGALESSMRTSDPMAGLSSTDNAGGTGETARTLAEGDESSITGENKDVMKTYFNVGFSQLPYLLKSGRDSFVASRETVENVPCIRYDGQIGQEAVLDFYEQFLRDMYVKTGMLEDKEGMTREDLKNEVVTAANGTVLDITGGMNIILFAEKPAPVSIWLDASSGTIVRILIDMTDAATGQADWIAGLDSSSLSLTVIESYEEYSDFVFDRVETAERPE